VTSGSSGSGNGIVRFTVSSHTSASARQGTLTIAGATFTVTQAAVLCTYAINPTAYDAPAAGATVAVGVTSGASCAWDSASQAPWITITAPGTGTGNGSVSLTIAANTDVARSGTARIAGQTMTVTQPAPCGFSLSATTASIPSTAGGGSVNVNAGAGCAWTATADVTWLQITAGSSGTGAGTVTFTAADNTGPQRTGTLTIAGLTFTVTQQGI
jgi:hypothetical protein